MQAETIILYEKMYQRKLFYKIIIQNNIFTTNNRATIECLL